MANFLVITTLALLAVTGGTSAAGAVSPANMIQAATACYQTLVHNAESMATVLTTGTPFADKSCFVDCAKELLGPASAMVGQQVQNAARSIPPPMRQCADIVVGTAAGASKNECQRIVDAAQCVIGKAMAMLS